MRKFLNNTNVLHISHILIIRINNNNQNKFNINDYNE